MEIFLIVLFLIIGLVLIVFGGNFFVDAASWMAEVSGVPKLIVGATVVSVATTLPELFVSSFAAARGNVDMAIGNAVGSVTANTALILAIGFICIPSVINRKDYLVKALLMIGATLVLFLFGAEYGAIGITASIILFAIFLAVETDNVIAAKKAMKLAPDEEKIKIKSKKEIIINLLKFFAGAAGIVFGANLLTDNGSALALKLGLTERIIGLTILAIGTSLPELVTTITAVIKKQASLSAGNVIGANVIDLTLILPISAMLSKQALSVSNIYAFIDLPICLICAIIAVVPALINKKFMRWQGFAMIIIFFAYMIISCMGIIKI